MIKNYEMEEQRRAPGWAQMLRFVVSVSSWEKFKNFRVDDIVDSPKVKENQVLNLFIRYFPLLHTFFL